MPSKSWLGSPSLSESDKIPASFRKFIKAVFTCEYEWAQIMQDGFPSWKGQEKVVNRKVIPGRTQGLREGQSPLIKISCYLQIIWVLCSSIKYSELVLTLCKRQKTWNIYVRNCTNVNHYVSLDKNVWDINPDRGAGIKTETEGKCHSNL